MPEVDVDGQYKKAATEGTLQEVAASVAPLRFVDEKLKVDIGGATINVGDITVAYESHVSTLNSTSTPLAAGATFLGGWEDVRDYAGISMAVFTDVASAANGAVIQFTEDTALGAIRSVPTTIPAGVGSHFSLAPQARYFRISYTNGSTDQTVFRSEVTLRFNPPAQVQQPIGATITDLNLATIVRAALAGRTSTGAYAPLLSTASGHLSTRIENTPTVELGDDTVAAIDAALTESGTFAYDAGASGTVTVPASGRVFAIAAHATTEATLTIDGGDAVIIPANTTLSMDMQGVLVAPVLAFVGTDAYYVDWLT